MPVRVNVPIKLTIAPGDLREQLDDVLHAVGVSVRRALVRSREAVIEPRGGYPRVECFSPQFTWKSTTSHVSPHMRELFERRVVAVIDHSLEQSGVHAYRKVRAKAPDVLPGDPAEQLDVERYDEELDLYWLPTYGGGGKKAPVGVNGKKTAKDVEPPPRREIEAANFFEFDSEDSDDFNNTFGWKVSEHFAGRKLPNVFGVLYRISGITDTILSLWERGSKTWRMYRYQLGTVRALTSETLVLDQLGNYAWERRTDPVDALAKFRASQTEQKLNSLRVGKKIRPEDKDAVDKVMRAKAEAAVADYTRDWETLYPEYYWFKYPGGKISYPIRTQRVPEMPPSGYAEIVPLAEPVILTEGDDDEAIAKAGGKYKLGKGEIPGEGQGDGTGGVAGGIGRTLAMQYDARWKSKFAFRTQFDPVTEYFRGRDTFKVVCEPYWGEPSVHTYPGGEELWAQIQKVADALEMPPCEYAANFAINAAKVLGGRAEGIGTAITMDQEDFFADFLMGEVDAKGEFAWKTVPSPGIQQLRMLAGFVPMLDDLYELIKKHLFPISDYVPRGYFLRDFDGAMEASIVWMYLYACQISLLQLLTASRKNIEERLDPKNLTNYATMTKILLTTVGTDQVELIRLRDALDHFNERGMRLDVPEEGGYWIRVMGEDPDFAPIWREYWEVDNEIRVQGTVGSVEEHQARQERWTKAYEQIEEIKKRNDLWFRYEDRDHFIRSRATTKDHLGEITMNPQNLLWEICDSYGKHWTMTELNKTIALRQQYIEVSEPILQHIKFTQDVPKLVSNPLGIEGYLRDLLNTMLSKNKEVRSDTLGDPLWAFEHSKIEKAKGQADYYGNQSGLHAMAHGALVDAFEGHGFYRYPWALEHLYTHQVGWVSLRDTFLFVGIVALSILCPPLGTVAGIIEAAWRYSEAKDTEALYEAQWDPAGSGIISRAEVEAQMFVAKLGLVLSFIPLAGELTGPVSKGIKAAVSQGLKAGAKELAESLLKNLAKDLAKQLGPALVLQLAALPVMNAAMSAMIDPFVEDAIREVEVGMAKNVSTYEKAVLAAGPAAGEDSEFYDSRDEDFIDAPSEEER